MILFLLPASDYDPTEAGVIWKTLIDNGFEVRFATPEGKIALADKRLTELGFSLLSPLLMPEDSARQCYIEMTNSAAFQTPISYQAIDLHQYQGLHIPGGHAQGMKTLLESSQAQQVIVDAFDKNLPVASVCHGVLLLARSINSETGRSVLHGRKTTALPKSMELSAWLMTWLWLKNYYRTYDISVETEVKQALASTNDFKQGPLLPFKDSANKLNGFMVSDGNYLSARWPGDCFTLAQKFVDLLKSQ